MSDADRFDALDMGSSHKYGCRCTTCLEWWVLMGPDCGDYHSFGPFTAAEVEARAKEMGEPFWPGEKP
mgnify:FL=1